MNLGLQVINANLFLLYYIAAQPGPEHRSPGNLFLLVFLVIFPLNWKKNQVPIKISLVFFEDMEKLNPNIHMEFQGIRNGQKNPEKEEQSWKAHTSQFKSLLQSYSNQKSLVLVYG